MAREMREVCGCTKFSFNGSRWCTNCMSRRDKTSVEATLAEALNEIRRLRDAAEITVEETFSEIGQKAADEWGRLSYDPLNEIVGKLGRTVVLDIFGRCAARRDGSGERCKRVAGHESTIHLWEVR